MDSSIWNAADAGCGISCISLIDSNDETSDRSKHVITGLHGDGFDYGSKWPRYASERVSGVLVLSP